MHNKSTFTFRRSAIWEGNAHRFGDNDSPYVLTVPGTGEAAVAKAKKIICQNTNDPFAHLRKRHVETRWDGKPRNNRKARKTKRAVAADANAKYQKGLGQRFILVDNTDHNKVLDPYFIG